jgi:hypothetical protein
LRLIAQRRARELERTVAVDRRADIAFAEYADARHDESGYHTTKTRRMKDGLNSVHGSHAAGASIALPRVRRCAIMGHALKFV